MSLNEKEKSKFTKINVFLPDNTVKKVQKIKKIKKNCMLHVINNTTIKQNQNLHQGYNNPMTHE